MFIKIILKNYKKNFDKYIVYSLCNILTVSMIYFFWSTLDIFTNSATYDQRTYLLFYDIQWDLLVSCGIITLVSIFMMFIAFKNYIWLRVQDYSMYLTLGMRRKRFLIMLGIEYLTNWCVSFLAGVMIGKILSEVAVNIISYCTTANIALQNIGVEPVKRTFYVSTIVAGIVFLGILTWLEDKNIGDIRQAIHANEKRPESKWWGIGLVISSICIAISWGLYLQGDWSWFYSHFLWIFAGVVFLISCLGVLLMWLKKKEFYYRHLVWLNGLYSKYVNRMVTISILFSIHFFVLGYTANWIASCLPIGEEAEKYCYDYIWMDKDEHISKAREITSKYNGTLQEVPMIRVYDFSEHIGISQDSYEYLTGEKINLNNQDILFSIPNRKSNKRNKIQKRLGYLHLYPGKYTNEQFLLARGQSVSENYSDENTFYIKYQISENVLGDYSLSVLPNSWSGSIMQEDLIVFSNEYFEKWWKEFYENNSEPTTLFLMNFPEETRVQAGVDLKKYVDTYGIEDMTQVDRGQFPQSHFYNTSEVVEVVQRNVLFYLICGVIVGLDLFLCSVFIFSLTLLTNYNNYQKKYNLLYSLGIETDREKKNLHREISGEMWISLVIALLLSVIYSFCCIKGTINGGREIWEGYWKWYIIITFFYCSMNFIVVELLYKILERKIRLRN